MTVLVSPRGARKSVLLGGFNEGERNRIRAQYRSKDNSAAEKIIKTHGWEISITASEDGGVWFYVASVEIVK
jgi:hypothetical protein